MADNSNKARPGEPNAATTDPAATSATPAPETVEPSKNASMRATLTGLGYSSFMVSEDIPVIVDGAGTMLTKAQADQVAKAAKASGVEVYIEEVK